MNDACHNGLGKVKKKKKEWVQLSIIKPSIYQDLYISVSHRVNMNKLSIFVEFRKMGYTYRACHAKDCG